MARPDRRRPGSAGEPQPNVLAEGNPVPNVLRGSVAPGSAKPTGQPAGREADTTGRPSRRVASGDRIRGPGEDVERTERPTSEEPAGRRASIPGCGCGGWAVLLGLLFVVIRLVGSCDEVAAPAATVPSGSPPSAQAAVNWHGLEPGDCFVWPEDSQNISEVTLLDCAVADDVEVVGTIELPDPPGAAYDEDAVSGASRVGCNAVYSSYAGQRPRALTGSGPEVLYPGSEAWMQDERTVICLAEGDGPGALVGSVRAAP